MKDREAAAREAMMSDLRTRSREADRELNETTWQLFQFYSSLDAEEYRNNEEPGGNEGPRNKKEPITFEGLLKEYPNLTDKFYKNILIDNSYIKEKMDQSIDRMMLRALYSLS